MFTRLAVFFSLLAVIIGIWFTMPSVGTTPVAQFSVIGDKDTNLAIYQKKPRKYEYDREITSGSQVLTDDYGNDISNISKNSQSAADVQYSNGADSSNKSTNSNSPVESTDKVTAKIQNPNLDTAKLDKADQKNTLSFDYKTSNIIPASALPNSIKSFSVSNNIGLTGFVTSSIVNDAKNVSVNPVLNLNFDTAPGSDMISQLAFYPSAEFTSILKDKTLVITPKKLDRGVAYHFGLPMDKSCASLCEESKNWLYHVSFTTDFKESVVYGKSVQGKDISANIYGYCDKESTCKKIMLVAGVHGSEWRSGGLNQLQSYIEKNPQEIIDKNKVLIVVTDVNPDAKELNSKLNAQGVDLNQNFPISFAPCKTCGKAAASEPETKRFMSFVLSQKPNMLLSFHAQQGSDSAILRDSQDNDVAKLARWISDRNGYEVSTYFPSIPGDMINWSSSQGIRSLTINTPSNQDGDWDKNQNLYLSLLRDY